MAQLSIGIILFLIGIEVGVYFISVKEKEYKEDASDNYIRDETEFRIEEISKPTSMEENK